MSSLLTRTFLYLCSAGPTMATVTPAPRHVYASMGYVDALIISLKNELGEIRALAELEKYWIANALISFRLSLIVSTIQHPQTVTESEGLEEKTYQAIDDEICFEVARHQFLLTDSPQEEVQGKKNFYVWATETRIRESLG